MRMTTRRITEPTRLHNNQCCNVSSAIEAEVKKKDKKREEKAGGDVKSRRQSIATSSLRPYRWSKISFPDAGDVRTSPERHSSNSNRKDHTLISTSSAKKQRRCSMNDAPAYLGRGLGTKLINANISKPPPSTSTRMAQEQEHSASSPTKKCAGNIRFRSQNYDDDDDDGINCSSAGLLRSAFGSRNSSRKKGTPVGTGNRVTSLQALNHISHASIPAGVRPTPGGRLACGCCDEKPVYTFKGGEGWNRFELHCNSLQIDLYWPVLTHTMKKAKDKAKDKGTGKNNVKVGNHERRKGKVKEEIKDPFDDEYEIIVSDDDGDDILPLEAMVPLCNFRNLRLLRLTGMSQSYQKYIWQTAWLNPGLEELELEMTLEPCIRRSFSGWPYIKGGWIQSNKPDGERSSYYGDGGRGILHRRVGIGEYLDKYAIEQAKTRAARMGSTLILLPVVKLSLTGFVVDGDPFRFFNPHRLRMINFKNDCVDAGFALPDRMREQVTVSWPKFLAERAMVARRVKHGELKLIDLGSEMKNLEDMRVNCSAITTKSTKITTTTATATTTAAAAAAAATAPPATATQKSKALGTSKGDMTTATPNFSYPNPRASVASPKCAAKCSAAVDDMDQEMGNAGDGNKLSSTGMGKKCTKDIKPQQRMRLFSKPWKPAKS
ncbi:hypothetical protein AJ78_03931 [Emergomyces pasteurianus Ep9510]|uniref:Uncharacterized protein n=1 Tax=Emergomyces pasteurianus Ep9510 TaxID=1447872 RepID=A0A1J9PIV2_9EURO|nr:hypothetical protein AJ78_03931 [Emergomyces pasteurianus Ep9510]